jgi:hypothetical protein
MRMALGYIQLLAQRAFEAHEGQKVFGEIAALAGDVADSERKSSTEELLGALGHINVLASGDYAGESLEPKLLAKLRKGGRHPLATVLVTGLFTLASPFIANTQSQPRPPPAAPIESVVRQEWETLCRLRGPDLQAELERLSTFDLRALAEWLDLDVPPHSQDRVQLIGLLTSTIIQSRVVGDAYRPGDSFYPTGTPHRNRPEEAP